MDDIERCADIPFAYAPYDFEMTPGMHDLIFGDQIKEGQIVLISDRTFRVDPVRKIRSENKDDIPFGERAPIWTTHDEMLLNEATLWCRVTNLRQDYDLVIFVGLYADGTKAVRKYHKTYGWYIQL